MKLYRDHYRHAADIGETRTVTLDAFGWRIVLERFVGVYGFRDTVTHGVRWHRL